MQDTGSVFISCAVKIFRYYKSLGDATFAQLRDEHFHFQPNEASNSIAIIIRHMSGNMLSRWTNFLHEDGEKPWRKRDEEFETSKETRTELLDKWEQGWSCVFDALADV